MTGVTGTPARIGGGMRSGLGRVAAVAAVTALGAVGCSGGKSSGPSGAIGGSKSAGEPGDSSAPAGAWLSGRVPSGFSGSTAWSTQVSWSKSGIGKATLFTENQAVSNLLVADQQAGLGVARTVGGSVVVPSFAAGGASGPVVATLKFLDAKTGKPLAEKALPSGTFLGLRADTVAGKPVAVVRYLAAQDDKTPVVVVFDASGAQVWTSQGQSVAGDGPWAAGLQHGEDGTDLIVGGYVLRFNVGKDTSDHTDSSYDVLDTGGKSVLHVPEYADKWDMNSVQILPGYAVVHYNDGLSLPDSSQGKDHFTVYDLAAGGKKAGELAVKGGNNGMSDAGGAVASGGKVLLTWTGPSDGGGMQDQMAVLDTATGQSTPPAALPGGAGNSALIDPQTSNVLLYDNSDAPSTSSKMVSLTHGTVLWTQHDNHGALLPLSLHNGVVYGVEAAELGSTDGSLLAVKETDGTPVGTEYELSPMDFTAEGAPLFAEVNEDAGDSADKVTVAVGRSG
jgi:hypothetical protein